MSSSNVDNVPVNSDSKKSHIDLIVEAFKDIRNTMSGGELFGQYAWYSYKQAELFQQMGKETIRYEVEDEEGKKKVRTVTMITKSPTDHGSGWKDIYCLGKAIRFETNEQIFSKTESTLTSNPLGKALWDFSALAVRKTSASSCAYSRMIEEDNAKKFR